MSCYLGGESDGDWGGQGGPHEAGTGGHEEGDQHPAVLLNGFSRGNYLAFSYNSLNHTVSLSLPLSHNQSLSMFLSYSRSLPIDIHVFLFIYICLSLSHSLSVPLTVSVCISLTVFFSLTVSLRTLSRSLPLPLTSSDLTDWLIYKNNGYTRVSVYIRDEDPDSVGSGTFFIGSGSGSYL